MTWSQSWVLTLCTPAPSQGQGLTRQLGYQRSWYSSKRGTGKGGFTMVSKFITALSPGGERAPSARAGRAAGA